MPHHPVVKPTSSSTKPRVAFDASTRTSSGISLNNILAVGPSIQPDQNTILLRFRLRPIDFIPDISTMYWQILVDRKPQRIFLQFVHSAAYQRVYFEHGNLWDMSGTLFIHWSIK